MQCPGSYTMNAFEGEYNYHLKFVQNKHSYTDWNYDNASNV